jgi:hypothetical protein
MRSALLFVLAFSIITPGLAQNDVQIIEPAQKDSVRDQYIRRFPDHFFLYPVLKQRLLSFELQKTDRTSTLTFKPNSAYNFGMGAYLFELAFDLTFAVPINEQRRELYGKSHARDLQLNILGKSFGLDAFYQRYTGFYKMDSNSPVTGGMPYPQRKDIESKNYGFTGSYIFNKEKFSFRSVYNFAERQLSSKGSFVMSASLSRFNLSADSSILNAGEEVTFGKQVSFTRLRYTTLGIAPGYTYSLIFKSFFLNGTLSIGPANHWITYRLQGERDRYETTINTFAAARIGIGYNGERFFGGVTFITQGSTVKFENVQFSNNNSTFRMLIGYRFRESGFLKKRVWDLVPFKI